MHVLLAPVGSHGDIHPFVGLGLALRERGHRVTFLALEHFGELLRGLGFEHEPLGDDAQAMEVMQDPDLWHPVKGFRTVMKAVLEGARKTLPKIEARYEPGSTVAVGGSLAFSVRVARERIGIPAATVHLQPAVFHSDVQTPAYPGFAAPNWWPTWLKRGFFNLVFSKAVEPHVAPGLNAWRAELGLPPVRNVMRSWIHSPQLVLGFFPEWFCPPQPDWPPHVKLVGFPLYDERGATPIPDGLEAFLRAGPPPIAFTPGSGNVHGRPFFEAAADACQRLGRRGVLLTRFPEQIPENLPEGVIHVPFAPFSQLLPRTAALVHHGGIGTSAQGMASGVPQLVMPLSFDQFDNAARMKKLGVASTLAPAKFRGPALARELSQRLDNPEVLASCRAVAARIAADPDPFGPACEAIEALNHT